MPQLWRFVDGELEAKWADLLMVEFTLRISLALDAKHAVTWLF